MPNVVTSIGRRIECDFVVIGVGVEPVTEIMAGSGVKIENGIVVDEYCQTNVESIYAAGDVANHFHPVFGRMIRVEHWQNAIRQGRAAARSMLGKREPYKDVQRVMPFMKARVQVDSAKLRDENIDLHSLIPGARPVRTHQHRIIPHPVARPGEEAR